MMNGWQALGFNSYQEYLLSDLWKSKVETLVKDGQGKCELCEYIGSVCVHHKSYVNVGDEKKEDLLVVCRRCHRKIHKKEGKNGISN